MANLAFVALKYKHPLERMLQTVDRHRAYLRELHAQGKLIASGPFDPRTGGGLLVRTESEEELQKLLAGDPFQQEQLVETTVYRWVPNIGSIGWTAADLVGNLHEWVSDGSFKGGYYVDAKINGDGCLYRTTAHAFSYHDYSIGFRCCAGARWARWFALPCAFAQ